MEQICQEGQCTSCTACYSVCPVEAIEMIQNEKGFYRPAIDQEKCIDCLQCTKVCPANREIQKSDFAQEVYACWSLREKVRENSSSGGIFTHLAEKIIEKSGIVFGAAFSSDHQIAHISVREKEELLYLQGSKYVQSNVGDSFRQIHALLEEGEKVLFAGVPCQVAGLKNFLRNQEISNLFLIDLVCHGCPSPRVYKDYLSHQQEVHQKKIESLSFRRKRFGWHDFGMEICFQGGKKYFQNLFTDPYIVGFLKNYFLNDSCYSCKFANTHRQGDITIADFWGYQPEEGYPDDNLGITLLIVNTLKGKKMYEEIGDQIISCSKTLSEAVEGNGALREASFKNHRYEEFWQDYQKASFVELISNYFAPRKRKEQK